MSERSAEVIQGGIDPQTALLHGVRQLTDVMTAAQSAGHEGFANNVASFRSAVMNAGGLLPESGTPSMKQALYDQGQQHIESLVQEASSLPGQDGFGSAVAGRISEAGARFIQSGHVKQPVLNRENDIGLDTAKSHAQQQAKSSVVSALTNALKGGQQQGGDQSATRWQDIASKPKGPSGPAM